MSEAIGEGVSSQILAQQPRRLQNHYFVEKTRDICRLIYVYVQSGEQQYQLTNGDTLGVKHRNIDVRWDYVFLTNANKCTVDIVCATFP